MSAIPGSTAEHPTLDDVLVVIPAWNEEEALPGVLEELGVVAPQVKPVVVSDGSRDATAAVARARGVAVLELPYNLGVGGALRAGFRYAIENGYHYVVQLDADGQHNPAEIETLCRAMRESGSDVVVGSRFHETSDYEVKGLRRHAMWFLSTVITRIAGEKMTDITSGFKIVGPKAVTLFSREYPVEYLGDTVEALVLAVRAGLRVSQCSVNMRTRRGGTPSHSPLKSAVFLVRAVLSITLAMTRPRLAAHGKAVI